MIKRKPWFAFLVLGMLTAMLWGCQKAELNQKIPAFQFVRGYGVVKSTDRVYVLNAEEAVEQTKGDVTITLVDAVQQGQKLIVNLMVSDYSEREKPDEKRYGEAIWITGEGIKVTGPGILEENSRPVESQYIPWSEFYEEYGYMRYFMAASFELSPDFNVEEYPAAYSCSILDFEQPIEFFMKQAPGYETFEELASAEGSLDTHDDFSILAVGEAVKEGILVEWYSYSESGRTASISFTPPGQIPDRPILSLQEREYPAERKLLYTKKLKLYQPEGVVPAGYLYNQLFPVPEEERVGSCFLTVPGITYLQPDESEEITLSIPKESEELDVEIPFEEGTVRIDKITRMTAQEEEHFDTKGNVIGVVKRPAVYIQVSAVSEKKELSLKSLICKRKTGNKAGKGLWENQRYDFNSEQNLSGFRVFYEEGDTEIVLKFSQSGFYWKQPYHLKLEL